MIFPLCGDVGCLREKQWVKTQQSVRGSMQGGLEGWSQWAPSQHPPTDRVSSSSTRKNLEGAGASTEEKRGR
jgi:hypothetical protein